MSLKLLVEPWNQEVVIVTRQFGSTASFYAGSRLGNLRFTVVETDSFQALPELNPGCFVVVVRDLPWRAWRWIGARSSALSGVALLLDDDVAAAWRSKDVPFFYGVKSSLRFMLSRWSYGRVWRYLLVSTDVLAQRYAAFAPTVLPPLYPGDLSLVRRCTNAHTWAYYGTGIHVEELAWLRMVVALVHQRLPHAQFELFGGSNAARKFLGLPRVRLSPYKRWDEFQAYCQRNPVTVSLCPLLPGRFNEGRSHVKIYDMLNSGSVGVFSDTVPYLEMLEDSGICIVPNDPELWASTVCRLLSDEAERMQRFARMRAWAIARQDSAVNLSEIIHALVHNVDG